MAASETLDMLDLDLMHSCRETSCMCFADRWTSQQWDEKRKFDIRLLKCRSNIAQISKKAAGGVKERKA